MRTPKCPLCGGRRQHDVFGRCPIERPTAEIGRRSGMLQAIAISPTRMDGRLALICHCDCGADCDVRIDRFRSGMQVSCGCAKSDTNKKALARKKVPRLRRVEIARMGAAAALASRAEYHNALWQKRLGAWSTSPVGHLRSRVCGHIIPLRECRKCRDYLRTWAHMTDVSIDDVGDAE